MGQIQKHCLLDAPSYSLVDGCKLMETSSVDHLQRRTWSTSLNTTAFVTMSQHTIMATKMISKKTIRSIVWRSNKCGSRPTTLVMPVTQENSVDLHTVCIHLYHSRRWSGENIQILSKSWMSVTAWPSFHWSPFVRCFDYNKPKVKFHVLNTQKTGIHRLLTTNKERPAFRSGNTSQGQLQTPQSVSVPNTHAHPIAHCMIKFL